MGSPAEDWKFGTVLRDRLDGLVAILLAAEKVTQLRGTIIGPPTIRWHYVLVASPDDILVRSDEEEYMLLFYQERVA